LFDSRKDEEGSEKRILSLGPGMVYIYNNLALKRMVNGPKIYLYTLEVVSRPAAHRKRMGLMAT